MDGYDILQAAGGSAVSAARRPDHALDGLRAADRIPPCIGRGRPAAAARRRPRPRRQPLPRGACRRLRRPVLRAVRHRAARHRAARHGSRHVHTRGVSPSVQAQDASQAATSKGTRGRWAPAPGSRGSRFFVHDTLPPLRRTYRRPVPAGRPCTGTGRASQAPKLNIV